MILRGIDLLLGVVRGRGGRCEPDKEISSLAVN